MDILAQYNPDTFKDLNSIEEIRKVIAPVIFDPTVKNYSDLVGTIDRSVRQQALDTMRHVLEQADMAFRKSADRTQRYYVTNTRPRSIITIYGELSSRGAPREAPPSRNRTCGFPASGSSRNH